jgi:hypothetical protein
MPESQAPRTPHRRVGIYERLGRARGSPAKAIGIAVGLLIIILIAIIIMTLAR